MGGGELGGEDAGGGDGALIIIRDLLIGFWGASPLADEVGTGLLGCCFLNVTSGGFWASRVSAPLFVEGVKSGEWSS